jgi:hypothetical protein
MKTRLVIFAAIFVMFAGAGVLFAAGNDAAPPKPAAEPAPPPAPDKPATPPSAPNPTPEKAPAAAPTPIPADLLAALKGDNKDAAKQAMDKLVAMGETIIPALIELQAAGDATAAPRATETLKRIGCVDGVYVALRLFHKDFQPYEMVGVQYVFRNYNKSVVTVLNPVSATDPEKANNLGWKMTLKTADGKQIGSVDMNQALQAAQVTATDFAAVQPGEKETYYNIMYAQVLFGFEKLDIGTYIIEAEYGCKADIAKDIKNRGDLKLENFFDKTVTVQPLSFKIVIPGLVEVSKEKAAAIKKLIEDLGSSEYETWSKAEKALGEVGPPALPFLKEAVGTTTDMQIKYKATQLINKIVKPIEEKVTYIGIRMEVMATNAVQIQGVMPDSPAQRAGLKEGDIITKVNDFALQGDTLMRVGYLRKQVQSLREGDTLKVTVQRQDGEKTLEVHLARIPKAVFGQQP